MPHLPRLELRYEEGLRQRRAREPERACAARASTRNFASSRSGSHGLGRATQKLRAVRAPGWQRGTAVHVPASRVGLGKSACYISRGTRYDIVSMLSLSSLTPPEAELSEGERALRHDVLRCIRARRQRAHCHAHVRRGKRIRSKSLPCPLKTTRARRYARYQKGQRKILRTRRSCISERRTYYFSFLWR